MFKIPGRVRGTRLIQYHHVASLVPSLLYPSIKALVRVLIYIYISDFFILGENLFITPNFTSFRRKNIAMFFNPVILRIYSFPQGNIQIFWIDQMQYIISVFMFCIYSLSPISNFRPLLVQWMGCKWMLQELRWWHSLPSLF